MRPTVTFQDGRLIAKPLSNDQTPYRKDERERIKAIRTSEHAQGREALADWFAEQIAAPPPPLRDARTHLRGVA